MMFRIASTAGLFPLRSAERPLLLLLLPLLLSADHKAEPILETLANQFVFYAAQSEYYSLPIGFKLGSAFSQV